MTLRIMGDRDIADDPDIGRYFDGTALASTITNNLYHNTEDARCRRNIRNGHVIERYTNRPPPERPGRHHSPRHERWPAGFKNEISPCEKGPGSGQSHYDSSPGNAHTQAHGDLVWLDEPQTLYLKKKLRVHDSVTFSGELADTFSSACVRDAMKKVKLVSDLSESADKAWFPVFAIDCCGKVIAWNKSMEQLTGIARNDMIGKGNYAYAVPLYGYARPMLIDYLVLPLPKMDTPDRKTLISTGDVITGREEMIWLKNQPRIIQGRAKRIHDEDGVVIGAIQSIDVHDPSSGGAGTKKEVTGAHDVREVVAALSPPRPSREVIGESLHDAGISGTGRDDCNGPGRLRGSGRSGGIPDHAPKKRPADLHYALGQLMATEDSLLKNMEMLMQIPRPLSGQDPGPGLPEELSSRVIMDASEGIIVFDTDLRCILWNRFMEHLTGLPASQVRGARAFDMFPALKDSDASILLRQALSGKMVESSDISFHMPVSGKQAWVRLIFSALHDNSGRVAGIIGIVQDTTVRKVMEYALQSTIVQLMESEEKYRGVFNAKNDPLLLVDTTSGQIQDLNDAALDLYGYTREEFSALPLADLFVEPEKFDDLLEDGAKGIRMYRQRRKDRTIFPADVSYAHVELKGRVVLLLSVRDLSSARKTAEALRLANTKLNLLIGVTRHDVINNLTVLMGYNDLLQHTVTDPRVLAMLEKEESALQTIHRQIEFTRQYYNLGVKSPVWQNVCDTATRTYSQFVTTIPFTCTTRDLEIYADPLLEKVFYNLFDNAIRHGENVLNIRVYYVREGADLLLIFGDDGNGIPPENKERIFRKGFGKHTGLGLFLTREILAITRIDVTETGEFEKGARFEFRIPSGHFRFPDSGNPLAMSGSERTDLAA